MFRSVIAGSALTTVLLVIVPIFGGTSGEAAVVASGTAGAASSSPVISGIETRGSADESSIRIIEMVERATHEAADDDSRDSDTEHSAHEKVAPLVVGLVLVDDEAGKDALRRQLLLTLVE